MTDDAPNNDETEYQVIDLESETGEVESFVIIGDVEVKGQHYEILATLEDMENAETMSDKEYEEFYEDESIFFVMRRDGETRYELTDDEFEAIRPALEQWEAKGED